jgi:hypothetical protein
MMTWAMAGDTARNAAKPTAYAVRIVVSFNKLGARLTARSGL